MVEACAYSCHQCRLGLGGFGESLLAVSVQSNINNLRKVCTASIYGMSRILPRPHMILSMDTVEYFSSAIADKLQTCNISATYT